MSDWPVDAPLRQVIRTLRSLGYKVVRTGNHISLAADLPDGHRSTMTLPNHRHIKGSTLRTTCRLSGIDREDFLIAYRRSR